VPILVQIENLAAQTLECGVWVDLYFEKVLFFDNFSKYPKMFVFSNDAPPILLTKVGYQLSILSGGIEFDTRRDAVK